MTTHIFVSSDCVAKLTADIFISFSKKKKELKVAREFDDVGGIVGKRRKQKVDKIEGIKHPNL